MATAAAADSPAAAAAAGWQALVAGGHVALIRHATAPGSGDPPGFRLDDCRTQRNLSAAGRAEAARIGGALAARGVSVEAIYSSQWCRCLETAERLRLGPVTAFPPLNSFFRDPAQGDAQMAVLRPWLAALRPAGTVLLVTHQVVVTALTGIVPDEGEIIVIAPSAAADGGRIPAVGRIPAP